MPGRLKRFTRPAIAVACVVALTLSFLVARAGSEPQAADTAVPAITEAKPAAATTTSALGPADGLPALAPERPKPPKRKAARPEPPAPPPAEAAAPAPAAPPAPPEPTYAPPPVPVAPAQPPPEPVAPPAAPPQPDPSPPVYFDDSG